MNKSDYDQRGRGFACGGRSEGSVGIFSLIPHPVLSIYSRTGVLWVEAVYQSVL